VTGIPTATVAELDEEYIEKMEDVLQTYEKAQCCTRDEGGPFGAGLQEQASNSRKLLRSNGRGGERYGKGVRESRHV